MEKEEYLKALDFIKQELYKFIEKEEVDTYYLETLEYCERLIKEQEDDKRGI